MTAAADARACRLCTERFAEPDHLALHLGRLHAAALDEDETAAFAAAVAREDRWLAALQRHVRAGFFVLPLFLFYVFTAILVLEMDGNPAWVVLITPGYVAFGALIYGMVFTRQRLKEEGKIGPGGRGI